MRRAVCGALLIGIGSAGLAQPMVRIEAQGAVWDGTYTSPDRSFQVRLPGLLMPGAVITDEVRPGGEVTTTFADDLCRQYRVHRVPVESPPANAAELKRFVGERLLPAWQSAHEAKLASLREVTVGRHSGIETTLKARKAPCAVLGAALSGAATTRTVAGTILVHAFVTEGAVYEVAYLAGDIDKNLYVFFPEAAKRPKDLLAKILDGVTVEAGGTSPATAAALSPQSAYYASIDVRASDSARAALNGSDAAAAQKAAADIGTAPGGYDPRALLELASVLHRAGNAREAAFWFYAGRLRARRDQRLCTDPSARAAVDGLFLGSEIEQTALTDLNAFEEAVKRVVDWDRNTPHTYDRRWPELLGEAALAARLGQAPANGIARAPAAPVAESAALDEADRAAFLEQYLSGIAKERERRAVSWSKWSEVTESGQRIYYVDFATMTVDGPLRSVWEVRESKYMRPSGAWSFLNQNQYDCVERRYRETYFSSVSGHMGEGRIIQWHPWLDEWSSDFTTDSPAERIRRAVCEHPAR